MIIYIDNNYLCHKEIKEERREFDVPFFDGKCKVFIEGYRYVPSGEIWTREDGMEFHGEMITPATDYNILAAAQSAYEESQTVLNDTLTQIEEALGI